MNILVVNAGSSSLKYQIINSKTEEVIVRGLCDEVGKSDSVHKFVVNEEDFVINEPMKDHLQAIQDVVDNLLDNPQVPINDFSAIHAVGHRVVQGGDKFDHSVLIDEDVIKDIDELSSLGPLHNPPAVACIRACMKIMPNIPHVAVFDTAFHQTMPAEAYMYPLPYEYYEAYGLRRYGAHGTSHRYLTLRAAQLMNKPIEELKIITCHLGNGASLAAVKEGKCIDTSMGLTPLGGMMMGTRCGDIDPAIVPFLVKETGRNSQSINEIMNRNSGLLGVSGVSNDMRLVTAAAEKGNERAQLALDMYAHICKKFIGSYYVELGGTDAIVFSAGVGENCGFMRNKILDGLQFMGIHVDQEANATRGEEIELTTKDSAIKVIAIPTQEELMIARDTYEIAKNA